MLLGDEMSGNNGDVLAPVVQKLARRTRLGAKEADALMGLPFRLVSSDPGDYVVRENVKPTDCVALLSGFAHRSKAAGSGATQSLGVHIRGDLLDVQNTLLENADQSVRALTPTQVARIPRAAILAVIDAFPTIALALWRDTLVDASLLREWTLNVGQRHARQRIAHLLCELALRQAAAGILTGANYAWKITQGQISAVTGMTIVHAHRTLVHMERDGLIRRDTGGGIAISDWHGLQTAGDFNRDYLQEPMANVLYFERPLRKASGSI